VLFALTGAWLIGILLGCVYLLPLFEYIQPGARMGERARGVEDRPPVGLAALPLLILPDAYGRSVPQREAYLGPTGSQLESAAAGYVGLLATLLAAPLAWRCRQRRGLSWLVLALAFFSLTWTLNVPGFVRLFRLPGLNMMSGNRYVFASAFLILALAVLGLDGLGEGKLRGRHWFAVPLVLLCLAVAWTGMHFRAIPYTPEIVSGGLISSFQRTYIYGLGLLALALAGWVTVVSGRVSARAFGSVLGTMLLAELCSFAYDRNPQCEPELYYPALKVIDQIAHAPPGRVLAVNCIWPNLLEVAGRRDIRGYDAVDPVRIVTLLELTREGPNRSPVYARTSSYRPILRITHDQQVLVPPTLNMLNLRYLVFPGPPRRGLRPRFEGDGYHVLENLAALPRAFLPRRVEVCPDDRTVLELLAAPKFDASRVTYVNQALSLSQECRGTAQIVEDLPCKVTVRVEAETSGLLVLADQWHPGWNATVNGEEAPVVVADFVLRGVPIPPGQSEVVFRYEPRTFTDGARLSVAAVLALLGWSGWRLYRARADAEHPSDVATVASPTSAARPEDAAKKKRRSRKGNSN
jgi:hypothetical protein